LFGSARQFFPAASRFQSCSVFQAKVTEVDVRYRSLSWRIWHVLLRTRRSTGPQRPVRIPFSSRSPIALSPKTVDRTLGRRNAALFSFELWTRGGFIPLRIVAGLYITLLKKFRGRLNLTIS
ncbi:MAG: hypothetical protein ABFD98_13040, partial [Syntrophobacteraceae bacterium]